jgi:hypothetical protein
MIGDPNWLYSTIAQSSAAIVAIVGGFITASVLMLASEKRSLRHQKDDKQTRLKALEDEERQLSGEYETSRVYEFIDAITDELIKEDELPSLEGVMECHPDARNLNPEILKRVYEETSKLRLQARQFIGQHSGSIDVSNRISFDAWISKNRLNIAAYDRELLEQEYDRFVTYEKERRAEEEEKAHPFLSRTFKVPDVSSAFYNMPRIISLGEQRRQEHIGESLSGVRAEIYVLKHEVVDLDRRLASFRDPQDLRWGLCVLGYLAGVGILFPLLIMAEEAYSTIANQFAIGLFFSGLMAIVGYIVFQINRLRR